MFNISNYFEKSQLLHVQNEIQLAYLQFTDATTFIREAGKVAIIGNLVVAAAASVFKSNPSIPLAFAGVFALSTLLTSGIARYLEPQAQLIINQYKDIFLKPI